MHPLAPTPTSASVRGLAKGHVRKRRVFLLQEMKQTNVEEKPPHCFPSQCIWPRLSYFTYWASFPHPWQNKMWVFSTVRVSGRNQNCAITDSIVSLHPFLDAYHERSVTERQKREIKRENLGDVSLFFCGYDSCILLCSAGLCIYFVVFWEGGRTGGRAGSTRAHTGGKDAANEYSKTQQTELFLSP